MATRDTLTVLAEQFALAFQRLGVALATPEGQRELLRELGWDFASPPAALGTLVDPVTAVTAFSDVDQVPDDQIPELLLAVGGAFSAIAALGSDASLPADFSAAIPTQLTDYIIVRYFFDQQPRWGYLLFLLGIISVQEIAAAGTRLPYVALTFAYAQLGNLFSDPLSFLKTQYQWGQSSFRGDVLLEGLEGFLDAWDLRVQRGALGGPLLAQLQAGALAPSTASAAPLWLVLIESRRNPVALNVGAGLYLLPETASAKPGFAVLPVTSAGFDQELDLSENVTLTLAAQVDLTSGVGLFVRPNQNVTFTSGLASGAPAPVTGTIALQLQLEQPGQPIVIIGSADTSGLQIGGLSTTGGVRLDGAGGNEVFTEFAVQAGKIVINPAAGDADSFLTSLLPAGGLNVPFDFKVGFSTTRGLYFGGSGGFEVTIPAHLDIGPVEVQTVTVAVRPSNGAIPIEISAAFSADLSVLKATADGVGLTADLTFPADRKGNLGPADLQLKFKPPTGLGIVVDGGPVSGGGFIAFDSANSRYFGAIELSVYGVAVKAFGVVETKLPTGPGYSFLIIISAEFTPIQLGLGFTLNGVGGLVGINRSVDSNGLLTMIKTGQLDNVLFPTDVVDNAPAILNDVETLFPPTGGHYVFGPLAKIGWGTPTLVVGELGLILELPGPVLTVLGTVHAALPTQDAAVVELNLDVGGVLDFPNKKFSLDASLHDSRVGDFPISGDMAMRMSWDQNANFALSLGGFNPHYNPPADFPKLKPISVALGVNGNPSITLSGYMALTSNTAQVGALLQASISKGGASLSGFLGFDALFVFSPFSFEADIEGGVKASIEGYGISLDFHGTLSGPSPWHLAGKVCVSLLFFSACVDFSTSLGGSSQPTLPGVDPWTGSLPLNTDGTQTVPGLQPALSIAGNWGGNPPAGSFPAVTLIAAPQGAQAPIDPLGSATFRQKAVPLDLLISSFAGTQPSPQRTLDVTQVAVGPQTLSEPARVTDYFAPGQYQKMKDADKLSAQSFVQLNAGFTISSDALTFGPSASEGLVYTDVTFAAPVGSPPTITADAYGPSQTHVTTVTGRSAGANGGLRNSALAAFVDPKAAPLVNLANELYTVANIANLFGATGFTTNLPRPVATTALDAVAAISVTARQTLQVAPTFFLQPSVFVL